MAGNAGCQEFPSVVIVIACNSEFPPCYILDMDDQTSPWDDLDDLAEETPVALWPCYGTITIQVAIVEVMVSWAVEERRKGEPVA